MNQNDSTNATDAVSTALKGVEAVEQPMLRRGVVTVNVTVEASTLADAVPSQEAVAEALARLGKGQSVRVIDSNGGFDRDGMYYVGTAVRITGITLA
jgi:hypothetical protein